MVTGKLSTVYGWLIHPMSDDKVRKGRLGRPGAPPNERTLRNFPMQGNGAEVLRLACIMGIEAGIKICMPVHDAVLIEAPDSRLNADVSKIQGLMAEASREVLNGFELRSDVTVVRHPDRYADKRGKVMWEKVMKMVARRGHEPGCDRVRRACVTANIPHDRPCTPVT
jgi:DNA polymerase I